MFNEQVSCFFSVSLHLQKLFWFINSVTSNPLIPLADKKPLYINHLSQSMWTQTGRHVIVNGEVGEWKQANACTSTGWCVSEYMILVFGRTQADGALKVWLVPKFHDVRTDDFLAICELLQGLFLPIQAIEVGGLKVFTWAFTGNAIPGKDWRYVNRSFHI